RTVQAFLREVLPGTPQATQDLAGDLITMTLSAAGKDFSASPRTDAEIEAYADAMADMFCAYIASLGHR
ncbi:MAG: TetR/AcrR family transcriptional regulator, partial [Mesorhizobium sp.]